MREELKTSVPLPELTSVTFFLSHASMTHASASLWVRTPENHGTEHEVGGPKPRSYVFPGALRA